MIVFLKSREEALVHLESYLKNKSVSFVSTSDLKKALNILSTEDVDCFFLSVDHTDPNCRRLPDFIKQTTNTPVVLFAEGTTQVGINYLKTSEHPFILLPPLSGPATERMILKAQRGRAELDGSPGSSGVHHVRSSGGTRRIGDFLHMIDGEQQASPSSHVQTSVVAKQVDPFFESFRDPTHPFVRSIDEALSTFSLQSSDASPQSGGKQRLGCFLLQSTAFTGIALVTQPASKDLEGNFQKLFCDAFAQLLEQNQIRAQIEDFKNIHLKQVDVPNWLTGQAALARKISFQEKEIKITFFSYNPKESPPLVSNETKMFTLATEDLKIDERLEFDVFIYLEKNKKYVRFSRDQQMFDAEKSRQLQQTGISRVYVSEKSEKNIYQYRIQGFLNHQIQQALY